MLLRKDDPWLDNMPIPDLRNWRVVDENDQHIGFVETLVVDRQNNAVEAVMIGPNDRFAADDIDVGENVVRVRRSLHRIQEDTYDREIPPGFDAAFRQHFDDVYGDAGITHEDLLPAYRFGREKALDADFAGRSAASAEEDLKAHYRERRFEYPFEVARGAVFFGYELVHGARPFKMAGLDREAMQILKPSHITTEDSAEAGASTSTMTPGDDPA